MTISYQINPGITAEEVLTIYLESGLNRPTETRRIQQMIDHATIIITAQDGDKLVGCLRAFTDYSFDCYLNDLAVHREYQKRGIGKELIQQLKNQLEDQVMIMLISAADAAPFYAKLDFRNFSRLEDTWYLVTQPETAGGK